MTRYTNTVVRPYDFTDAEVLSVDDRITRSLEAARRLVTDNGYQSISDFPCVPATGVTGEELTRLESDLGTTLPKEYRQFLSRCRYLKIDDGKEIGGLDHDGIYTTEIPWVSNEHRPSVPYLVFANFWQFADGDQLMFDLTDTTHPVVAYLHEHGPLYELYAPSFSLALWRLTHDVEA